MRFVIQQSDLSQALSLVRRSVPDRPTHPILGNFLIKAEDNQVVLTGFDLSISTKVSIPAEVKEGGAIAVPTTFADIIGKLPTGEITINSKEEGEGFIVAIKPKSGSYKIKALSAEEFPELPEIKGQAIAIPASILQEGLKASLLAASDDETKQVLTGVRLSLSKDGAEFAATDGHRLSVFDASDSPTELEVTIPAKALERMLSLLPKTPKDDEVIITVDEGQAKFAYQGNEITSRTLEGQYPMYRMLVPKTFERMLSVNRKQLISAIERVCVFADNNGVVKFSISSDSIQISAEQESGAGSESIEGKLSGEGIVIAFNYKYLLEGLKAIASEEVAFSINKELTPVIINPVGGAKHTYLVMPIQVRS